MGINTNTNDNVSTTNVRYSAFLGMLYVSNEASYAVITDVKNAIGETEVKKGFVGTDVNSASGKARAELKAKGITPITISGNLTGARILKKEKDGREYCYLNVGLKDKDGKYYLSIPVGSQGAQMLVRKLVNAVPGKETEISLFATYAKKEGADRAYAEHGVSLKQGGEQVKGISPVDALKPRVDAAIQALKDAGVDDNETLNKRRNVISTEYHKELMVSVEKKFSTYYDAYYEDLGVKTPVVDANEGNIPDLDDETIPF